MLFFFQQNSNCHSCRPFESLYPFEAPQSLSFRSSSHLSSIFPPPARFGSMTNCPLTSPLSNTGCQSINARLSLSLHLLVHCLSLAVYSFSLSLSRCLTGGHWTKLITDERRFVEVKERDHSDISLPFISSVHLLYFHFAYLLLSCDTLCVPTHILFALHLSTVPPVPLSPPVCSVLFMYFFLNRWYFILNGKEINKAMI